MILTTIQIRELARQAGFRFLKEPANEVHAESGGSLTQFAELVLQSTFSRRELAVVRFALWRMSMAARERSNCMAQAGGGGGGGDGGPASFMTVVPLEGSGGSADYDQFLRDAEYAEQLRAKLKIILDNLPKQRSAT